MSAAPPRGVAGVYRHIIDDVVTRVRTDFVQEGVDEAVLDELRDLWETKLDATGAIAVPAPAQPAPPGPVPQYYQPVQFQGAAAARPAPALVDASKLGKPVQYLQPTGFVPGGSGGHAHAAGGGAAAGLAVPAAHQTAAAMPNASVAPVSYATAAPVPQPAHGLPAVMPQQRPQYVLPLQLQQQHSATAPQLQQPGQPPGQSADQQPASQPVQQYMPPVRSAMPYQQPQPQQPQVQHQQAASQQAQAQQLQQPPHQQSASQPMAPAAAADTRKRPHTGQPEGGPLKQPYQPQNGMATASAAAAAGPSATIPQRDGNDDDEAGPSGAGGGGGGHDAFADSDEGDDPLAGLSSDDDAEGADVPNTVLAQFEKVSRTKTRAGTKWKCQLKNGIMHLNGRDIIFHKCNGEMHF